MTGTRRPSGFGNATGLLVASAVLIGACAGSAPASRPPSAAASVPTPAASVDLLAIRDAIFAAYEPELLSLGIGRDFVTDKDDVVVALIPTATEQADEILARYGSRVRVSVGFFAYPPPAVLPPNPCPAFRGSSIVDPGPIRASLELPSTDLSHAAFRAKVRLTNTGTSTISISTGEPLAIYLFRPGESTPIGGSAGGSAGVGLGPTLKAGASTEIEAGGGTGSCDLALGYELPDGRYDAKAAVELDRPSGVGYFWSQPLAIQLGPVS